MKLLLVDDDPVFSRIAARTLGRRGFEVACAGNCADALGLLDADVACAVVDLVLGEESGLALVARLRAAQPEIRILVLTGYASIATAVEAVKLGADNYLAKPADVDSIIAALRLRAPNPDLPTPSTPLSVDRLEWEHIQRVLTDHAGNISATARALKMHRRTLQRKLAKRPVRD
ncbi:MAG: response regulator transcription factor [Proteobacteria bacterium]|nr:response regulator transcription factor [Pseudomonadota bacterium]HQR04878.1 response regulator transcription factor [Rhodocyclaceae bacterium]